MMYKESCCAAIKVDGKVLREVKPGEVLLPFGSEYSVYFKNMSNRKASLKVEIDGEDVLDGRSLIVHSNSYVNLERFYETNNKFKFIKMTDKIANYRGAKAEDGVIRLEWQFEYEIPKVAVSPLPVTTYYPTQWYYGYTDSDGLVYNNNVQGSVGSLPIGTTVKCFANQVDDCHSGSMAMDWCSTSYSSSIGDSGFTTKGSESNQSFTNGSIGWLDPKKHNMCFYLRGTDTKLITVKDKIRCEVCGTNNLIKNRFCPECGTAIVI